MANEPFIVKHYVDDDAPTIKGNGFDGLRIGDNREEADEFIAFVNAALQQAQQQSRGAARRKVGTASDSPTNLDTPPQQPGAQAVAWMHEDDPDRVIAARMKAAALRDGGASASSVAPYTIALHAGASPPPLPEGVSEEDVRAACLAHGVGRAVLANDDYGRMRKALESYRARLAAKGGV